MDKLWAGIVILILTLLLGNPAVVQADVLPENLTATIAKLDAEFFDAYNRCDLEKFASLMDENVEFYHDLGGVTWKRQDVIDGVRKNICGKVRREIVEGTFRVSPIKDFGAFEITDHRFCEIPSGNCVGVAQTAMLWRLKDGHWQLTRIFSYDHRPIEQKSAN
ncbi:MAG: nuclear transport factor 2 family protein [Steroidobacterales bacterium]